MSKENWHKGYKEIKNAIHNDIGVTKEEVLDVFRQVAKDEIQQIVSDSKPFIYNTIREVIKHEMIDAINEHRYPEINGRTWIYGRNDNGKNKFKDYIAGVMKEEIVNRLKDQFEVNLNINKKEEKLNNYLIVYYNRFANETQTYKVAAKNAFRAGRLFYQKKNRKAYHDCIETIEEI